MSKDLRSEIQAQSTPRIDALLETLFDAGWDELNVGAKLQIASAMGAVCVQIYAVTGNKSLDEAVADIKAHAEDARRFDAGRWSQGGRLLYRSHPARLRATAWSSSRRT